MLKVWVWKNRTTDNMARVSPAEPERHVRDSEPDHYSHVLDIVVCAGYIRRITGRAPTLKPRAFWFQGCTTKPPSV